MKFSNSQIVSFNQCEKRYYFEHVLKLRAKGGLPMPMERGINGHLMFEAGLKAMMEGKDLDGCLEAINEVLLGIMGEPGMEVYRHVVILMNHFFDEGWKPLLVEQNLVYPVAEGIEFAFTPDAVFQITKGVAKGKVVVIDFKFVAQYWADKEIAVFQQLPKYINGLNATGGVIDKDGKILKIRHAALIMLNTRAARGATNKDMFLIKWLNITPEKLVQIDKENIAVIKRMKSARDNYEADDYLRSANIYGCKICPFSEDLCGPDLAGHNIQRTIERAYEKNTYFEDNYGEQNESSNVESVGVKPTETINPG